MKAVVLHEPGPVEHLHVCDVPMPQPRSGWARIRVKAFGVNRSELFTRQGLSGDAITFPRILGIEATGVIDLDPTGTFREGQQVATMMGGMGRVFDGGYAQYVCVPVSQIIPFQSTLEWERLGAVPEMLQTAYGSLTVGVDAHAGDTLLIRGGTSSVGLAATVLAKRMGLTVLSTTRSPSHADVMREAGADIVLVDDGDIAAQVRAMPSLAEAGGVDGAIELVGAPTLRDTCRCVRMHGTVCFTGMLSNQWTIPDFYPIDFLPQGVRLTAYSGEACDLPADVLQSFLDDVSAGRANIPIGAVFDIDHIQDAHRLMEEGGARGKIVVTTGM
ncbi:NADPH:quinone reductase [Bifidobacterium lemurum]|uniref:NADPH:quinone reductase n=1 Tax=Bifidobacterium lemurum TaxID=1603886 RepID=A0A261FN83_9BIFI|nr:zinc-binding alcohol dehydrogenase family protein [Bifidobacterium lemurum]OZG60286.1 NADPH:quinone reductase [Bifidobacterium lemurum]QOL35515.1 zinc-binding dehydrogenase [Bifidobacterium lemurum]